MAKKHILIAEDDKLIFQAYRDALESAGYTVSHAADGEEALEKITKEKQDLVLLDLRMPKKSGCEVLEELAKQKSFSIPPIIVTSNLDHESDIKNCKRMGVKEYLVKANTSIEELVAAIEKHIK